jgi:hypothetical protein
LVVEAASWVFLLVRMLIVQPDSGIRGDLPCRLQGSNVKIVGQKRPPAWQGKRRAGHFPRSATKQRLESGLGPGSA